MRQASAMVMCHDERSSRAIVRKTADVMPCVARSCLSRSPPITFQICVDLRLRKVGTDPPTAPSRARKHWLLGHHRGSYKKASSRARHSLTIPPLPFLRTGLRSSWCNSTALKTNTTNLKFSTALYPKVGATQRRGVQTMASPNLAQGRKHVLTPAERAVSEQRRQKRLERARQETLARQSDPRGEILPREWIRIGGHEEANGNVQAEGARMNRVKVMSFNVRQSYACRPPEMKPNESFVE